MYQFMFPAKTQRIRDIGAIRSSNENSQRGRRGWWRKSRTQNRELVSYNLFWQSQASENMGMS